MRKIFLFLFLLIPFTLSASVEWNPTAMLSLQYSGIVFGDSADRIWHRAGTGISANPLSISINGRHSVSLPIEGAYISESNESGRVMIPEAFSITVSLRYGYYMLKDLELSLSLDAQLFNHIRQKAASWAFGLSIGCQWYPISFLGISVPLGISLGKGSLCFDTGIALILRLRSRA